MKAIVILVSQILMDISFCGFRKKSQYFKQYGFYCLFNFDEQSFSGIDSTTKSMKIGAQQIMKLQKA